MSAEKEDKSDRLTDKSSYVKFDDPEKLLKYAQAIVQLVKTDSTVGLKNEGD